MRIPSSHARADISENMMTPMIDVVFNLLIFFVVASALSVHEMVLPTDLAAEGSVAAARSAPPTPPDPLTAPTDVITIHLRRGNQGQTVMQLNGTDYEAFGELQSVLRELAEVAPESPVVLDIEHEVEAGQMVRVYDTCRQARFETIQFAAGRAPP